MYVVKEKKVDVLKIVLISAGIAAVVGAAVATFIIWKKKSANKQIEKEIDAAIDAALAEEENADEISVEIV